MNILVVGGTRFFGIPMMEKLIEDGHDITIATRGNAANPFADKTKQIILDRTDYDSVKAALAGQAYDVIIDKIAYCSNDVKNLLENVKCKRYIQMSSCAVYPEDRENLKEEDFDPSTYELVWMNRSDDYAEGKRQAERATLEYMDMEQCVFVRYPVLMGPNDYTGRLKFYVQHVLDEKPMQVDDLDFGMEFIYEKEAGEFIAHLVTADISGPVNGCASGMLSTREILEKVEKHTGKKACLEATGDAAPYNGTTANLSYDTTKAKSTGFQFSQMEDWIDGLLRQIRTCDFLDRLGISYQRVDHEEAADMETCLKVEEVLGVKICKNLFLCNRQKTAFYLLMMPGDKKFKTKELSAQINSARLSFADAEDMEKYLDILPGSVSVLGLMNDGERVVQLLIDEDVLADEFVGCHPCINTSTLKLKTKDVIDTFLPAVKHEYRTVHLVGED